MPIAYHNQPSPPRVELMTYRRTQRGASQLLARRITLWSPFVIRLRTILFQNILPPSLHSVEEMISGKTILTGNVTVTNCSLLGTTPFYLFPGLERLDVRLL